jgi:Transport and Golgi organisation 2
VCVLTYLPLKDEGFILTHNRDESIARTKALAPRQYNVHHQAIIYPKDPVGGGTWMATSAHFTLCLLNGAFEKHVAKPPYRQSRGLVILDFFQFGSLPDFVRQYQFIGIEPFTLVVVDKLNKYELTELRWDGQDVFIDSKDNQKPHIWSSATLYSATIRQNREQWFGDWCIQNADYEAEKVLKFHHTGGNGDIENDLKMNRKGELMTQCIMQIQCGTKHRYEVMYQDLLSNDERKYCIL